MEEGKLGIRAGGSCRFGVIPMDGLEVDDDAAGGKLKVNWLGGISVRPGMVLILSMPFISWSDDPSTSIPDVFGAEF